MAIQDQRNRSQYHHHKQSFTSFQKISASKRDGLDPSKEKLSYQSFTPTTSKDPSPTKLQETTQRMRNQNISALREHFGRARASSTPKSYLLSGSRILIFLPIFGRHCHQNSMIQILLLPRVWVVSDPWCFQ